MIHYIVLGAEACKIIESNDWDDAVSKIEEEGVDLQLRTFDTEKSDLPWLLSDIKTYGDYIFINKNEFKQLSEL